MNLLEIYTPHQLTEISIREKKRRQERREAGTREATSLRFESAIKTMKRANHSKKRGCRSCK